MQANFYNNQRTRITLFFLLFFIFCIPALVEAQSYKIMPLGNSITEGSEENPSYRYDLYRKLKEGYIDFNYVGSRTSAAVSGSVTPLPYCQTEDTSIPSLAHEGHWGWRADEILYGKSNAVSSGKLSDWLQGYTPHVVLMHLGSNDIFQNQSVSGTVSELREIVRVLRQYNPNVTILMAKLFPAHAPKVGTTAANNLKLLNDQIPVLAKELNTTSSPVILVDQNTGFDPTPGVHTYDGIHPNATGANRMAARWYDALKSILSSYTTAPVVEIKAPLNNTIHQAGQAIAVSASASDREEGVKRVEFFANCQKIGEDFTSPYQISWTPSATGNHTLTAEAIDGAGARGRSATINIKVEEAISGSITKEFWADVAGSSISSIPVTTAPTNVTELSSFEAPSNVASNYGQRVRGYITAPATGSYVFWIASDDNGELWLSTDENPANKRRIAYVNGWTDPRQWDKYTTQKSAAITLQAGRKYYIEALHKEGWGGDHLAVGWKLPDGALERPIPGSRLLPYESTSTAEPTSCAATGTILREHWSGVSGSSVSDIPLHTDPGSTSELKLFEAPGGLGSSYGARVRGYICPPQTGYYTFWIAADDDAELWLSTSDSPSNKKKIASVTGWTNSRQWDKYASQKSAAVRLEAGKRFYIEALHKQGYGGDNLAVAWQLPDGKTEAPIPGARLSPYSTTTTSQQPIVREVWHNISGSSVSAIPVGTAPNSTSQLALFEAPSNTGDNYGARVRAFVHPPATGSYVFWIASDDNGELWLSTDENPANKRRIAYVNGWTDPRQWDKYTSQKSAAITLQADRKYYIEALHKEGWGGDNLAVGWQLPDGTLERPIPGSQLSPYLLNQTTTAQARQANETEVEDHLISFFPNPFKRQITLQLHGSKEEKYSMNLYDISGRQVWQADNVQADKSFAIGAELEAGIYILKLSTGRKIRQYRLVKAR